MKSSRVVVDSNVLISAVLQTTDTPAGVLHTLQDRAAILLMSDETEGELHRRLMHAKFDRYVSAQLRRRFLSQLDALSERISIANRPMGCRDRDDDKFLELAVLGDADCIITGDEDLLVMHPFKGIPILRPAAALKKLAAREEEDSLP
jgi:uncharacterized protein